MTRTNKEKRKQEHHDEEVQLENKKKKRTISMTQIEQQFQEARERKLTQWYEETSSEDASIRAAAESRLQLQQWLRDQRRTVESLKRQCDKYKSDAQGTRLNLLCKRLKRAENELKTRLLFTQRGMPVAMARNACELWAAKAPSLQYVLDDSGLDEMIDFRWNPQGLPRPKESQQEHKEKKIDVKAAIQPVIVDTHTQSEDEGSEASMRTAMEDIPQQNQDGEAEPSLETEMVDVQQQNENNNDKTLLDQESVNVQQDKEDLETNKEQITSVLDPDQPLLDPKSIWAEHAAQLKQRYRRIGLTESAIDTKFAFQKKMFNAHAHTAERVGSEVRDQHGPSSAAMTTKKVFRMGIIPPSGSKLTKTTYSEHTLWELTSPLLWRYYKNSFMWEYCPYWVPRGLIRIKTVEGASQIFFDFGTRCYESKTKALPYTQSFEWLTLAVPTYPRSSITFDVKIALLPKGLLKVRFPVAAIVKLGNDSGVQLDETVELNGAWIEKIKSDE